MSNYKELNDYIDTVYNFNNLWKEKCSKYNVQTEQPHVLPSVYRIIVIGDIHGDWDMLNNILKIAKVIDNNGNWNGGKTVVVQVGDQVDRCRHTDIACSLKEATPFDEASDIRILKYLTELNRQASINGGAVYSLMGNHELMNVDGNLNYVSYKGLREFDNYKGIKDGAEARAYAFKPGNEMSEFLACTRQVALIIGSNLFVHGGILPEIAKKYNVQNINKLMSLYLWDKLNNSSKYNDLLSSSSLSPLWTRMFGHMGQAVYSNDLNITETKEKCDSLMNPLKELYKINRLFIGHTPLMQNGIGNICNGQIWLTDYGSSKAFDKFDNNGRSKSRQPQVLEILNDGQQINIIK
jgi:hypothetical protein